MAPEGDACAPTQQVDPSPVNNIQWSVYDGCTHPGELGAVIYNGSSAGQFDLDDDEKTPWFSVSDLGIMNLDTLNGDENTTPDENTKPVGDFSGIIAGDPSSYPKYFTWIARIDTSYASTLSADGVRGIEIETDLGDSNARRIKAILRPDKDPGILQLDHFLSSDSTAEADVDLTTGYHIYQVSFQVEDPATATDNITATIYLDGALLQTFTGDGRDGGSSGSMLRFGEGSGSPFFANVDWLIWSDSAAAATLTPAELFGELPDGIGELGSYGGTPAVLDENFDAASDGDGDASNFFTADYKALSSNAGLPFYNVTGGSSNIVFSGGQLSLNDARFTLGDATPDILTTAGDTTTRGDLDLSQPYRISFDVLTNDNVDDADGKCQVYVDNNTSGSSNSVHSGGSKIFEKSIVTLADGDQPTGTVTIESDPDNHVGTATSFLQLRCDSHVEIPITIDNLVVEYQ